MCYDGPKRAALELRFAQTHDSYTDRPYMRSFFALPVAMGFVMTDAGCTSTYANTPSTTQPTYLSIDDSPAAWYRPSPWTADTLTKPLGWISYHRHVRRIMGRHHGLKMLRPSLSVGLPWTE
jgi:hypothetical protein